MDAFGKHSRRAVLFIEKHFHNANFAERTHNRSRARKLNINVIANFHTERKMRRLLVLVFPRFCFVAADMVDVCFAPFFSASFRRVNLDI